MISSHVSSRVTAVVVVAWSRKEGVLQSLFGQKSVVGVKAKQLTEKVKSIFRGTREGLLEAARRCILGPLLFSISELLKFGNGRAVSLRGSAQVMEDLVKHFILVPAHEDWLLVEALSKDAANGPDVDTQEVVLGAKNDFWSSVPERDDGIRLASLKERGLLSKSKISQFKFTSLVN